MISDPISSGAISEKTAEATGSAVSGEGDLVRLQSYNSELRQKAEAVRAGFKRPAVWVMVFGWSLALCAGLVNVVAMQSWGSFASHVTGTTTTIGLSIEGFHAGRHDFVPLWEAIELVLSFFFGAFLCGLLIDKNQIHFGGKSLYGVALVGNGTLLALSVLVTPESTRAAVCLAAMACGLQNAMCTSHFGAVVRTTHVTGTVTDIGSTLGRMSMVYLRRCCRRSPLNELEKAEVGVDARKLLVLGPMWLSFLLGCTVGAYMGTHMGVYAMLVPAAFTFIVGLTYMLLRKRFKQSFNRLRKERLSNNLVDAGQSLSRTQGYLNDLRKAIPPVIAEDGYDPAFDQWNPEFDLSGLEAEVELIMET